MFPTEFYDFLNNNSLIEIKGGVTREKFLEIWVVEVDKRIFARSWNKSIKSWFTEFERTGIGQIKCADWIIDVKGQKIDPTDSINSKISEAYIKKYNQKENLKYAEGIASSDYYNHTMEFSLVDSNYNT